MSQTHVAILGAGPIGLEAALAAAEAGLAFTVYEAGREVADHLRAWGHVRLFSPWDLDVSPRLRRHLAAADVNVPAGDACPTGHELRQVLRQAAELPAIRPHLRLGERVREVGREGLLKHQEIATPARAARPFRLLVEDAEGGERIDHADVVLDCTGTYGHPNATGDGGIAAPGEAAQDGAIVRQLPDFERDAAAWAGRHVLLVGGGHSALTAACELATFVERHPGTRVTWALRRPEPVWETIADDALPERRSLVERANRLAQSPPQGFTVVCGAAVERFTARNGSVVVTLRTSGGSSREVEIDRVLSLTGFVGDHRLYRQLQVHECYATSGPMKLSAALFGAGATDCLAQTSHGADTLTNPEPGFFILGAKSYGRNVTFLMRTGWQQVEEVLALLTA